jgi:hypothetical protein
VLPAIPTGLKNKFGKERTSCVVRKPFFGDGEPADTAKPRRMLGPTQTAYFKVLWEMLQEHGEPAPAQLQLPRSVRVVALDHVWQIFKKRSSETNENTRKSNYRRATTYFQNHDFIRIDNDLGIIWWTGKAVPGFSGTQSRLPAENEMPDGDDEFIPT